ncbi:MAG: hypothetical protein ACLQPD_26430 [Desulfomonilaceae bacterium]
MGTFADVTGTVKDPAITSVRVVIRPEPGGYWVQGQAPVEEDQAWSLQVQFGEPGLHYGHALRIKALRALHTLQSRSIWIALNLPPAI